MLKPHHYPHADAQAEFSANAEKTARGKTTTSVISGHSSGTQRATVQVWHLKAKEHDVKNRKRFGRTDDHTKADWPHTAGAYTRIESSNKGRGDKPHARLERSQSGRFGCHSLPRNVSNRRHLPRALFSLYK